MKIGLYYLVATYSNEPLLSPFSKGCWKQLFGPIVLTFFMNNLEGFIYHKLSLFVIFYGLNLCKYLCFIFYV